MKALVLHGPGNYGLEREWKKPCVRQGWLLIKVAFAGICGSDLPRFAETGSYHHPMILGHEFSGLVDEVCPGSSFRTGEKVAILPIIPCETCEGCKKHGPFHCVNYQFLGSRNDGGFAEYCLVPEKNLFRLPEKFDLRYGALIEPLAVALHVVRRSGFIEDETALVFGAGGIGLLIASWLKILQAKKVVVADVRGESLEIARKCGFETINPAETDMDSTKQFDCVFEAAGANAALLKAMDMASRLGKITIVGRDTKDCNIPLKYFEKMMRKELTIKGCWGYDMRGEKDFVYQILEEEKFNFAPIITREVDMDNASDIIEKMINKEIYYCKILVRCSKERQN